MQQRKKMNLPHYVRTEGGNASPKTKGNAGVRVLQPGTCLGKLKRDHMTGLRGGKGDGKRKKETRGVQKKKEKHLEGGSAGGPEGIQHTTQNGKGKRRGPTKVGTPGRWRTVNMTQQQEEG